MKIMVKRKHIRDGIPKSFDSCPIARAICETIGLDAGYECNIHVDTDKVRIGPRRVYLPLPKRAEKFIDRFDDGKPVKPFSFQL